MYPVDNFIYIIPISFLQLRELGRTNTIDDLTTAFATAILASEYYVSTTEPFNAELESWIESQLGNGNDDDDDNNDGGDGDNGNDGDDGDNGASAVHIALPVSFVVFLVQWFLI